MLKNFDLQLLILIIGRVLQIVIALIAIKLATNILSPSEMGNYYLIISIAGFFGFFLVGPIGQLINRKIHQWHQEKKLLNVLYLYNYYIFFLALLSIAVLKILHYLHVGEDIHLDVFIGALFIYIFAHTWNQTIIPMFNMLEYRVFYVLFTLVSQIMFLFFAYLFIFFFDKEGIYWFMGQGVGFGLVAIVAFRFFYIKIEDNFSLIESHNMLTKKNFKKLIKFSAPLFLSSLLFWMQTQSYPLIIEKFVNTEFLGYIGVGFSVAFAISTAFESIIMQYIYPQMYKSMQDNNEFSTIMSKIINLILPIYLFITIFVSFFAIYINTILVDSKYFDSYIYVVFGVWIAFFRISSNIIANIAHAKLNTKALILPSFLGAFMMITGIIIASNMENYKLLIPSAMGCRRPCHPTVIGPILTCICPMIFLSK